MEIIGPTAVNVHPSTTGRPMPKYRFLQSCKRALLQLWRNRYFGIGLPVVLGCTFTAVGPMISIGSTYGVPAIYGAIIAAGLIVVLAAGLR